MSTSLSSSVLMSVSGFLPSLVGNPDGRLRANVTFLLDDDDRGSAKGRFWDLLLSLLRP